MLQWLGEAVGIKRKKEEKKQKGRLLSKEKKQTKRPHEDRAGPARPARHAKSKSTRSLATRKAFTRLKPLRSLAFAPACPEKALSFFLFFLLKSNQAVRRKSENQPHVQLLNLLTFMKKTIKIRINLQFAHLCDLLGTSPEQVFVNNVSLDVRHSHSEEARSLSVEYFMSMNYGTHVFDMVEIGMVFSHLEHIRQDMQKKGRVSSVRHYREWYECWNRPRPGIPVDNRNTEGEGL